MGDPRFLVDLAERAEAAGWDGLFLEDYVCYGGDRATPTCNVWAVLAAVAVRTRRIRLGTEVTPLTRRRPWNVAREAAAVDQLSDGRMVLGVGLGDTGEAINADASYLSFGEERDARTRGEMLDEGLEIIAGLWTGEPFSFRGKHYRVDDVTFLPRPVQQPRIPIWIGGGYPIRARRVGRSDGMVRASTGRPMAARGRICRQTTCAPSARPPAIARSRSPSEEVGAVRTGTRSATTSRRWRRRAPTGGSSGSRRGSARPWSPQSSEAACDRRPT